MDRVQGRGRRGALLAIRWIAAIGWLTLYLVLSWQTGEETVAVSSMLTEALAAMLRVFGILPDPAGLHHFLRVSVHFFAFLIAAVLFQTAFLASLPAGPDRRKKAVLLTFAICTAAAALSEVCKLFIPGRHLDWGETALNELGLLCGLGALWILGRINRVHK